jgi:hypothetical protein
LIGSSTSAIDISRDIARVAKEVHVAARSFAVETSGKQPGYANMWFHPMVIILIPDLNGWPSLQVHQVIDLMF